MTMDKTCYKCEDRVAGCHSVCEKYIKAKEQHEKEREEIRHKKQLIQDSNNFEYERKAKMARGR